MKTTIESRLTAQADAFNEILAQNEQELQANKNTAQAPKMLVTHTVSLKHISLKYESCCEKTLRKINAVTTPLARTAKIMLVAQYVLAAAYFGISYLAKRFG